MCVMDIINNPRPQFAAADCLDIYYNKLAQEGGSLQIQMVMEIHHLQPIIIGILRAQTEYLSKDQMDEIVRLGCAIWWFYRERPAVSYRRIPFEVYTTNFQKHLLAIALSDGMESVRQKDKKMDTKREMHRALHSSFESNPILCTLENDVKGLQLAVLKSLIDCLDGL